ncbi:AMP-binding protein [Streptomyces sp. M19]
MLTAGAAYIATDPAWPRERTADVVARSGARLVVGGGRENPPRARESSPGAPSCPGPSWWRRLRAGAARPPFTDGTAAACVFYTSGSTGRPKGSSPAPGHDPDPGRLPHDSARPGHGLPPGGAAALGRAVAGAVGAAAQRRVCRPARPRVPALDADGLRDALARGVNSLWLTSSLFNVLVEEAPNCWAGRGCCWSAGSGSRCGTRGRCWPGTRGCGWSTATDRRSPPSSRRPIACGRSTWRRAARGSPSGGPCRAPVWYCSARTGSR